MLSIMSAETEAFKTTNDRSQAHVGAHDCPLRVIDVGMWVQRTPTVNALIAMKLLDDDLELTEAGWAVLGRTARIGSEISKLASATSNPSVRLLAMDKEKRALLEQAARCRSAAVDFSHRHKAAKKLKKMAVDYESRAAGLEEARLKAELPGRIRRRVLLRDRRLDASGS